MEQAPEALKKLNVFAEMRNVPNHRAAEQAIESWGLQADEPADRLCRLRDMAVRASRGQVAQGGEYR